MSGRTPSRVQRVLAWLVGASVVLCAAAATSLPLNVAHRGYSAAFPENTQVAVEAGFAAAADVVELHDASPAGRKRSSICLTLIPPCSFTSATTGRGP